MTAGLPKDFGGSAFCLGDVGREVMSGAVVNPWVSGSGKRLVASPVQNHGCELELILWVNGRKERGETK